MDGLPTRMFVLAMGLVPVACGASETSDDELGDGGTTDGDTTTGDGDTTTGDGDTTTDDTDTTTGDTDATTDDTDTTTDDTDTTTGDDDTTTGDAICGDGNVDPGEECDDTNDDNTDGCLQTCVLALTCKQILAELPELPVSEVYTLDVDGPGPFMQFSTFCDMTTDGGGWTLLGQTTNNQLTLEQQDTIRNGTWDVYTSSGYGDPVFGGKIFWLALEHWNELTSKYQFNVVRIVDSIHDMRMQNFAIANAELGYAINWLSPVMGYAQMMVEVKSAKFTTLDQDNDIWMAGNCATDNLEGLNGGWWYVECYQNSMLHADGNLYSWHSNATEPVTSLHIWFREG